MRVETLPFSDSDVPERDDDREALYKKGITFDEFLAAAERRKERWHRNSENSAVDPELLARARAVKGHWRILAVAVDSCSDSVSTIPYLAQLESEVDGLEMRIIDSTVGREVMMAHLTVDGRAATPTVVLLNDAYEEVGCFVERPAPLQNWVNKNREGLTDEEYLTQKFAWYDNDAGTHTVEAIVRLMEMAAAGNTGC
jgi:Thioredoxin